MINYNDTGDVTATNHIISIINHNNDNYHYTTLKYKQILEKEKNGSKDFSLHLTIILFHITFLQYKLVLHSMQTRMLLKLLQCYYWIMGIG